MMDTSLYRVAWRSKKTGATGYGTCGFPFAEYQRVCDELGAEHGWSLTHWPERMPMSAVASSPNGQSQPPSTHETAHG